MTLWRSVPRGAARAGPGLPADRFGENLGAWAALTSRLQSFETAVLTQEENLAGVALVNRSLIAKAEAIDSLQRVVLHMDSTEIPVYGQPMGSRV